MHFKLIAEIKIYYDIYSQVFYFYCSSFDLLAFIKIFLFLGINYIIYIINYYKYIYQIVYFILQFFI
jgi:hypothetical protein